MKTGKIELIKNNYVVKFEDGNYLSTFHAQNGLVPIAWEKKYNSIAAIKERVKDIWNIEIV